MDREWPSVADEFAAAVTAALTAGGGIELARQAEADPAVRVTRVREALAEVGLLGMDVGAAEEESAATVRGVQAAGAVVAPWPVAAALAAVRVPGGVADGVFVTHGTAGRLEHVDLFEQAVALDTRDPARARMLTAATGPDGSRLDPFGCRVTGQQVAVDGGDAVRWRCVLDAFWVLGALDTVVRQAVAYSTQRKQFGSPIGTFGEIRWRLADMVVARDGLDELARYTWWALRGGHAGRADVLALRLHMLDAAACVLTNGHQIFGAIGLCDEHDVALIDRHLQPVLNRPGGPTVTSVLLADAIAADGFAGTFPVPPRADAEREVRL
ncbi:acyl-CoA dehydrogenase family protein [Nocardia sp. alder85J]|uniref:acyl-CoA dehydrogenase family protein n=1 Tax=Nocardia sp. alder85J TaxID=2862949 RepID=UPI001CD69D71|nr:acyl-CoA dehydrogenase family protein [Nocardia sp. alder85J]MCX4096831.1 acyl-CoA dehydrogenase family protein [Nocardia sp. alder85J]